MNTPLPKGVATSAVTHFLFFIKSRKELITRTMLSMLLLAMLSFQSFGQLSITPWRMNYGGGRITGVPAQNPLGNPAAYAYMNIPAENASGWSAAPLDNNGAINFSEGSILGACQTQLDFTYFESFLDIPAGTTINDLRVSFVSVDDGARAYIFNSAHPNGAFNGEIQIGSTNASLDYSALAVIGERNRIVIVQFDSCPVGNTLRGANVVVNGTVVAVDAPPTAEAKNINAELGADGTVTISPTDVDNGSSDAETANLTYALSQTQFACTDFGNSFQVTLTVTDEAGNTDSANATVTITGTDTDSDGYANVCDLDDDNDGIVDSDECVTSDFQWSSAPTVSGGIASGTIDGIGYSYSSNLAYSTTT
ncbi:MAG: hypothetical protein ACJAVN_001885, partial [Roseivirga sp.]